MSEPKWTILCVDDEQDIVDSLFDTFMDSYYVKTATSAENALKIVQKNPIDLIIADQRMPGMTGTELFEKLSTQNLAAKKILLTGYADINAAIEAINKGSVDRYFSKPWDEQELVSEVHNLMSLHKADKVFKKIVNAATSLKDNAREITQMADMFSRFLNSCHLGVILLKKDRTVGFANRQALELLKYGKEEPIINQNYMDIIALNSMQEEKFQDLYNQGILEYLTVDIKTADGSCTAFQTSIVYEKEGATVTPAGILFYN